MARVYTREYTNIRSTFRSVASLIQYRLQSGEAMQVGWHISPNLRVGEYLEGPYELDTVVNYGVVSKTRLRPRIELQHIKLNNPSSAQLIPL